MRPAFTRMQYFDSHHTFYSPVSSPAQQDSSEDSLSSDALQSETPPRAPSPKPGCDTEVSSKEDLIQGRRTSGAGHAGVAVPMNVDGGGDRGSGPQPDTVLEALMAPRSGKQPPLTGGGDPSLPTAFVQPKASGGLLTTLERASIIGEHRALMGVVIEKIQAAESGLNESCVSLIKGLEVCEEDCHGIDSSP